MGLHIQFLFIQLELNKYETDATIFLPQFVLGCIVFGPSGRCAGGLAAANVVATIFGIFSPLQLFFFSSFLLTVVAKTP